MFKTITVDDVLPERCELAVGEVKQIIIKHIEKKEDFDDLVDLDYDGSIHETVDSVVPIYTKDIDTAWYLYKNELLEAYENSGIGNNPMENDGRCALYLLISDYVYGWWNREGKQFVEKIKNEKGLN